MVADRRCRSRRPGRPRPALAISGTIGAAGASWFKERLDEAHLAAGDVVLLSSPGGNLNQAIVMGEAIRARGLTTAVGVADPYGRVRPSYCASACVLVFAGGKIRIGVAGSTLGVHRFRRRGPEQRSGRGNPADRGHGFELHDQDGRFFRRGGGHVRDRRHPLARRREAAAMNLVTEPAGKP